MAFILPRDPTPRYSCRYCVSLYTAKHWKNGGAWCGCVQGAEPTGKHIPAIVVVFLFPAAKKVFLPSRGHGEAKDRNLNQTEPRTWWEDAAYSNLSSAARSGWWCGELPVVPFSLGGDFSLSLFCTEGHTQRNQVRWEGILTERRFYRNIPITSLPSIFGLPELFRSSKEADTYTHTHTLPAGKVVHWIGDSRSVFSWFYFAYFSSRSLGWFPFSLAFYAALMVKPWSGQCAGAFSFVWSNSGRKLCKGRKKKRRFPRLVGGNKMIHSVARSIK